MFHLNVSFLYKSTNNIALYRINGKSVHTTFYLINILYFIINLESCGLFDIMKINLSASICSIIFLNGVDTSINPLFELVCCLEEESTHRNKK